MIYVILVLAVLFALLLFLIWMRKIQYDAVHRNFLDMVDNYGGKVVRGGFAVRPRYTTTYKESQLSVSISAEKKTKNQPRQFYISVFMQAPAEVNFTIMNTNWLERRKEADEKKRFTHRILNKKYLVEVADKALLQKLDFERLERIVEKIDPFAYVLVSKRGMILERISTSLVKDTEFEQLEGLAEGVYELSRFQQADSGS